MIAAEEVIFSFESDKLPKITDCNIILKKDHIELCIE